jgi:ferredoxin
MCEFCTKHGEGKTWYLQAKNYAEDLLNDARRQQIVRDVLFSSEQLQHDYGQLDELDKAPPALQRLIKGRLTARMKRDHFGQVLPIEDVERIFGFVNSITRLPCVCRRATRGLNDARYCYGVALGPGAASKFSQIFDGLDASFLTGPDTAGLEPLDRETALGYFREHEKEGLCHSVWTFGTPFIGGICNCDRSDCMAMQTTVVRDMKVMFRAEYVAELDAEKCTGCRSCMRACQFGALGFSAAGRKLFIDQRACYGCGVCRAACTQGAISLRPRAEVPVAAKRW